MSLQRGEDLPTCAMASSPRRPCLAETTMVLSEPIPSSTRKSQVFQRRLKDKISESRALKLLDRRIKEIRVPEALTSSSNQEEDEELVSDSTMVRFDAPETEEADTRVCGLLKLVRSIHRQRGQGQDLVPSPSTENQRS